MFIEYKKYLGLTVLLINTVVVSAALHAEVYKWVDADGNIHYGDKPQAETSEQLKIPESSTQSSSDSPGDVERRQYRQRLLESMTEERQKKNEGKAKQKAERKKQQAKCNDARTHLKKMQQAGFIYRKNKKGERVVYNDEQHAAALNRARARVAKRCK